MHKLHLRFQNAMKNQNDVTLTTVESYAENADEYIKNTDKLSYFPGLQGWLDKFIELLPGPKVLDVAFGSGRDLLYMQSRGLNVEGIELVDEFILILQSKTIAHLYKMDMRKLEFKKNSFDGIWCCSAFLHIHRKQAVSTLKGFSQILQPNGIIFLSLKLGEGSEWKQEGNISTHRRYFTYYTLKEIGVLLNESGFEIVLNDSKSSRRQSHTWLSIIGRKI